MASPRSIGFLCVDGVQALDLFGPLEAFQEANELADRARPPYRNLIVTADGGQFTSSSGIVISADHDLANCPPLHTLIIPGGEGARRRDLPDHLIDWIKGRTSETARFGSICTGLFLLARTGLADGQAVTTHWRHIAEAAQRFPALNLDTEALYLRSGKMFTAAGVTAGIDLALALIEEDLGAGMALGVAKQLVMFIKRPGDQRQYSHALRQQSLRKHEFTDLLEWIAANLDRDLSSFNLARRSGQSERHFRRRFTEIIGETPTRHVERLRTNAAASQLESSEASIDYIATETGFAGPDTFRRAFVRQRGVTPSEYRQRFRSDQT